MTATPILTRISPVFGLRILAVVACLWAAQRAPLAAQNMLVSPPLAIRNDYGYELVGRLRDRILLFRDRYDDFEMQAFDNQMQLSWSKELDDIDKRGTQILAVVGSKNDFSVIYKTRRRSTTYLRIHKYDPGASLIDSMTVKNYGERVFETPVLDIVRSEDKNCFVVYNTAGRGEIEATCFRLDKMQVLWDRKIYVEENYFDSRVKDLAVSNLGEFFLVAQDNNRRSKIEEHEYQIHCVSGDRDRIVRVPMEKHLTRDVFFTFDNQNRRLTAAGLFADKNRDRANGTFYLSVPAQDSAFTLRFNPFDDQFVSVVRGKEVEDDSRGLSNAEVQQVVLRRDGGVVLVGEQQQEVQRGTSAGRGFWREGVRLVIDYYYNDMFAIALGPDGHPDWNTVLHKKQYSQDDEATFSSFFLFRMADRLHFLFNDEIKYENTCSEYTLDPLGAFDRNSLLNTENQSLRLRFRDGLQLSANECLIPSEYRNKLRLVLLRY